MRYFSLFYLLLNVCVLTAQTDSVKKINWVSATITGGQLFHGSYKGDESDFQKIAPESKILQRDFSTYGFDVNNSYSSMAFGTLHAEFRLGNKDRTRYHDNLYLRCGISLMSIDAMVGYGYYYETKPYDTVYFPPPGQPAVLDSIFQYSLHLAYHANHLRLESGLLFSTDRNRRWSFYGGGLLSLGLTTRSDVAITYSRDVSYEQWDGSGISYYRLPPEMESEYIRAPENFGVSLMAPYGLNWRWGIKNRWLRYVSLNYEISPGLTLMSVPGHGMMLTWMLRGGIGLKFQWN